MPEPLGPGAEGSVKHDYDRIFHAGPRRVELQPRCQELGRCTGPSRSSPLRGTSPVGWESPRSKTITNPEKNLSIGSWYLNYLHDYFDGNSFLAVPAYNAGEGNVGKWAKEWGHRPTDEYVEAIPIRETRHYVKRVLGTYQLYRVVWGDGPVYPDWSDKVHVAWKK